MQIKTIIKYYFTFTEMTKSKKINKRHNKSIMTESKIVIALSWEGD